MKLHIETSFSLRVSCKKRNKYTNLRSFSISNRFHPTSHKSNNNSRFEEKIILDRRIKTLFYSQVIQRGIYHLNKVSVTFLIFNHTNLETYKCSRPIWLGSSK